MECGATATHSGLKDGFAESVPREAGARRFRSHLMGSVGRRDFTATFAAGRLGAAGSACRRDRTTANAATLDWRIRNARVLDGTGAPARRAHLGLRDGRFAHIGNGLPADFVLLDVEEVRDHATPENPRARAAGIRATFVNGRPVMRDGRFTGALPGKVLRRSA